VGDAQKYRLKQDIDTAMKEDCIANFEKRVIKDEIIKKDDVKKIHEKISAEIEEAVNFARESPYPETSELLDGLYA
jgi:pyruvate dehydrogenase E1 component alpha subunit